MKTGFLIGLRHRFLNYFVNKIPFWCIRKLLYKIFGLRIGKDSRIGLGTFIISPKHIIIGNNTIINEKCYLDGRGGLLIGNNCSISMYAKLITGTHNHNSLHFEYITQQIEIFDNVWIGTDAVILNGSKLGTGSIIGAGCVFKGVALNKEIYVGNPAKKIKEREIDYIDPIVYKPFFK